MAGPRQWLRAAIGALDGACSRAFMPEWNPLLQLGALGWFFYWIVAVSGIYLYVFFDTGVARAYDSVESLTHAQPWAGGVMRSLHRYASDGLVAVAIVHLAREFALDRMRGKRWYAWITGLPLLALIYVSGITGYWLVWDVLAQYVAQTSAELLDVLPLFGEPISRNFVNAAALSSRFFTLMSFLHIAAPLLLLLFMWVHIQRHAAARIQPARGLGLLVATSLLALAVAWPAVSQGRADLDRVPAEIGLDWFYLPAYPLVQRWGGAATWQVLGGALLLLGLLPWFPRKKAPPVVQVSLANCNGCGRCAADCPYGALSLEPRSDGRAYTLEAVVDPDRCLSCGICVGSCPTATPFRSASALVPGIELPQLPLAELRDRLSASAASLAGDDRLVIFACDHAGPPSEALRRNAVVAPMPCIGMLPPSFIDFVFARRLADGVVLAGCPANACRERLGQRWTDERIAGLRDPWLRARVPRERVAASWSADLESFRSELPGLPPFPVKGGSSAVPRRLPAGQRWPWPLRVAGTALALGLAAGTTAVLAAAVPWRQLGADEAVIRLSIRHSTAPKVACKPLTPQQMAERKPSMRRPVDCPRERWPVYLELERDGRLLYRGIHPPSGLWDDGVATAHRAFRVPAGPQAITVRMRDSGRRAGFDHVRSGAVELAAGQNFVIEFGAGEGFSWNEEMRNPEEPP
jgi:quinol-cytochrome oxidoreductase complex cytochrome b subunit/coenzyme F420-reducing hydrogenase delta subunit